LRLCGLRLLLGRGRLWQIFFEQRLEGQDDHEGQNEDEKEAALGAGFLLRILKVWQGFGFPQKCVVGRSSFVVGPSGAKNVFAAGLKSCPSQKLVRSKTFAERGSCWCFTTGS